MKKSTAIKLMLSLLIVVILFHLSIIIKLIPYDITWGGSLKNDAEMYVFEFVSILINLILCFILMIKGKFIREFLPMKIVNITLWVFVVLFGLNTVGNIFAETNFEKSFSFLTLAFTLLLLIILRKNNKLESE